MTRLVLATLFLCLICFASVAFADPFVDAQIESSNAALETNLPVKPPYTRNNLVVEMLGRAGLYSLNYDRHLGPGASIGIGASYMSMVVNAGDFATISAYVLTVPLYGNFYFDYESDHRFLGTAGLTIVNAKANSTVDLGKFGDEIPNNPFVLDIELGANATVTVPVPVVGTGYEYRSRGGFLFRSMTYLAWTGKLQPWAGLSFGSHY